MDYMTFIARIFGPLLAIASFWHLTYRKESHKILESFKKTPAMIYLVGVINLLIGLIVVVFVPTFEANMSFLIPLFGWYMIVRALLILFFPGVFDHITKRHDTVVVFLSLVGLLWGLLLTWFGFFYGY